jgi:hypothetical protein
MEFVIEVLMILIHVLGSTDKILNNSRFHVIWAGGLEVQIKASMNRFPAHFR